MYQIQLTTWKTRRVNVALGDSAYLVVRRGSMKKILLTSAKGIYNTGFHDESRH